MTAAGVVWCGRVQNCIECNNECKNIPTTTTAAIITTHEPYNKELLCGYLTDTTNNDWRAKERTNNERYAPQGEKKSSVEKITTYTQKSSNHCMKKTFKCWHCTCNDATLTDCSALPPHSFNHSHCTALNLQHCFFFFDTRRRLQEKRVQWSFDVFLDRLWRKRKRMIY